MVLGAAAYRAIRRACGILFPMIPIAAIARAAEPISGRASVIDGDTIEIHSVRIRLPGIDAPEARPTCRVKGKTWRGASVATSRIFAYPNIASLTLLLAANGHFPASRLAAGASVCYAWHGMIRPVSHRVFALLLGVMVALGVNLSGIRTGDMVIKVATASLMDDSGMGVCSAIGCGDVSASSCAPFCTAWTPALLPSEPRNADIGTMVPPLPIGRRPHGRSSPPEPHPPRFIHGI